MNWFDATKAHADPRSVALSDEVYAALGVGANLLALDGSHP